MPLFHRAPRSLFLVLLLFVFPSAGRGAEPPALTTLSDKTTRFRVPEKHYVVLKRGGIEAVIVDNEAVDDAVLPGHKAGYSGVASLKGAGRTANFFVPAVSGLNFEHIHDGTVQDRKILFEPRNAPMQLRIIDEHTVELYQAPTPHYALESCLRYRMLADGAIEMTLECIPTKKSFANGYVGLFWASYINQPKDLDIHFKGYGRDDRVDVTRWIRGITPKHGVEPTHLGHDDNREFKHDEAFPLTLVFNRSKWRYYEPWYYGVNDGTAFVQMFRPSDGIRLSQSPSGGGMGNPAWDFQFFIPEYQVGQRYQMVMRAMLVKYESPEQIERASAAHRKALVGEMPEELTKKAKAVLAQIEGTLTVRGLKEPVEVLRDRHGIPHIYAKNQDDLFFAQGFVTAQDRLFQMDWWRRVAVGETAAVLGKSGLEGDRFARLVRYRGDMDAEWASYGPDTKQIATAFTNGINAYIDHLGDRLPIEFTTLGYRPGRWQAEDCLGRMAGIIMIRNFANEIARAELIAAVGVEKARRLAPTDPVHDYGPLPGLNLEGIDRSVLAAYKAATEPVKYRLADADGSNNWVIDGTLSASGKPMLASDPHRALALPALRYLVHLNAPGWNVIGSGEPALPGVAIGHNERIAWGITIVGTDQSDLYVEETNPDDSTQYKVGDRWEKMTIVREMIVVKGEPAPIAVESHFTRHGPVLHRDAKRQRAYALKWVGAEPGAAGYLGSLALDRARNRDEFLSAIKAWKLPSENTVYADIDGNIGWVAAALTPIRKGWDGLLPVPGASDKYEWQGFLPVKELPQTFNPASHFIVTANHNILPRDYAHPISYEWALGYRYERLRKELSANKKFTLDDFRALQHDTMSLPGKRFAAIVGPLRLPPDAPEKPFADLVADWDGALSAQSRAGLIYSVWSQELLHEFFRPYVDSKHLQEFVRGGYGLEVMLAALEKPDRFWFGDFPGPKRDQLLRQTLTSAVKKLEKLLPGDAAEWRWGRLHTASFEHPLANLGPAYAQAFSLGPVERGGDGHTPNNARYDARFRQIHGALYRQVFDLADWDRGLATSVPGQSGQPGSPHYGDLLPLWAEGRYFPLPFSRAKVEESTRHRLLLKPTGP